MKASELKGKAVVSMVDGVQIGRVEDVLFDTTALRVAALVLTTTGGRSILPFAAVRSLGADAVTVESATDTQPAAAQGEAGNLLRALGDLTGLKVVNGEGVTLGDIRDVTIEQANGALTELEAHSGGMLGMGWHDRDGPRLSHPRYWTRVDHGRHARAYGRRGHIVGKAAAARASHPHRAVAMLPPAVPGNVSGPAETSRRMRIMPLGLPAASPRGQPA
jgi:sporulation protein YlmC with PRC-barrel domain